MKTMKVASVLVCSTPFVLAPALLLAKPAWADSVIVTNSSAHPVPVTGTVTNPSTAPVFTSSTTDPGRTPYQSQAVACYSPACSGAFSCSGPVCVATFTPVPAGKRLVIQNTQAQVTFGPLTAPSPVYLSETFRYVQNGAITYANWSVEHSIQSSYDHSLLTFNTAFPVYADAGPLSITYYLPVDLQTFNPPTAPFTTPAAFVPAGNAFVTGYLIDCDAAPCAPIVQ